MKYEWKDDGTLENTVEEGDSYPAHSCHHFLHETVLTRQNAAGTAEMAPGFLCTLCARLYTRADGRTLKNNFGTARVQQSAYPPHPEAA